MTKRVATVFFAFIFGFTAVFIRTGLVATDEKITEVAATQALYTLSFGKTRGKIYDCNINELVDNNTAYVAACLPTAKNKEKILNNNAIKSSDKVALLEIGKPFLADSTMPNTNIEDVVILPSVRRYAQNQPAQHIIGYLSAEGSGVSGIEKAYDKLLSQKSNKSKISYVLDPLGNKIENEEPKINLAPIATQGVVLTIDLRIQRIIEEAGKGIKKGAIVVMEPESGNILATASFPSYSVYNLEKAVADEENSPMINRAFMPYSTGSVFKIVTAAAAIEGNNIGLCHECIGYDNVDGQIFRCHNLSGHGMMNLTSGMENSCNPYFIELGKLVGADNIVEMAKKLSIGQKSTFAKGMYTSSGVIEYPQTTTQLANISFGQGSLSATPIQIARMISSVVNGGYTPPANLVLGTTQDGNFISQREPSSPSVKAMEPSTAKMLKEILVSTIMEQEGQLGKPQYVTAGGKTGTAQTGRIKQDNTEQCHGWFAGFFPADNPKYTVVVFEEDSEGGNASAAPIFREIADKLYAPLTLPDSMKNKNN